MKKTNHIITQIVSHSPADNQGILVGDELIAINGSEIEDIFDYQYLSEDESLSLELIDRKGVRYSVHINKEMDEDLGLVFDNGLMDDYKSCHNKCIFCFIDQMPPGMRETLYFKDDDSRLSFLQGNYVTLTNMSQKDVDRICRYHLSPINISFQTTDPELRCMMLNNRFAGESLKKVDAFMEAGITMNGQIVLCKGINDGAQLEKTIEDLTQYLPNLQSVSVVPVGLSKFREGLYPLSPFTTQDAINTLKIIEKWQSILYEKWGLHFIHASDEWYILAGRDMPEEERYDGYLQLENGVGMVRLLLNEVNDALANQSFLIKPREEISLATGKLMYPILKEIVERITALYPNLTVHLYDITNDYFGELITVSGLITGTDLKSQLMGKPLGKRLLIPENMLRAGENYFLDDVTVPELSVALQVPIEIVKSSGHNLVDMITRTGRGFKKFKRKTDE